MPVKCMECGQVFRVSCKSCDPCCPKCGSVDYDLIVKDYR